MTSGLRPPPGTASARVERLVERAMTYVVDEYDDDLAVARLAWLARDDEAALDQACDGCLKPEGQRPTTPAVQSSPVILLLPSPSSRLRPAGYISGNWTWK